MGRVFNQAASGFLFLACCLASAAQAASPSYQLSCVPASADTMLSEHLKARLDLHGWQEAGKTADYRLCFRLQERQQLVASPPMNNFGPYYGNPYWNQPEVQVIRIRSLELTATRADGSVWQAQQDLPDAETPALQLERGARQLIERLPLE